MTSPESTLPARGSRDVTDDELQNHLISIEELSMSCASIPHGSARCAPLPPSAPPRGAPPPLVSRTRARAQSACHRLWWETGGLAAASRGGATSARSARRGPAAAARRGSRPGAEGGSATWVAASAQSNMGRGVRVASGARIERVQQTMPLFMRPTTFVSDRDATVFSPVKWRCIADSLVDIAEPTQREPTARRCARA